MNVSSFLFEQNNITDNNKCQELSMEGDILFFSNVKDFFKHREAIKKEGTMFYSWINLEGFGEGYKKEIELIKDSDRWRSYEDRDFFEKNIGALMKILSSYIKTVEKKGRVTNGKIMEEVIYTIE
ncbi:hypothetical protein KAU13_03665 [candidate division WOR-3 bacterium]|nr:hypothetical protein [candidate division WOR-3 bacterium]